MGRRGPVEEDDAVSAVSELEEQGVAGGAGSGGRGAGCCGDSTVPPNATLHGVCRTGLKGGGVDSGPSFVFSFVFHARSPFNFLVAPHIVLGQAWAEGKGELATCRHCADSGLDTDCIYPRHDLIGRMRVINKQKKKILTLLSSNRGINPRMITTSDLMLKSLHAEERGIAFWGARTRFQGLATGRFPRDYPQKSQRCSGGQWPRTSEFRWEQSSYSRISSEKCYLSRHYARKIYTKSKGNTVHG